MPMVKYSLKHCNLNKAGDTKPIEIRVLIDYTYSLTITIAYQIFINYFEVQIIYFMMLHFSVTSHLGSPLQNVSRRTKKNIHGITNMYTSFH